MLRNTFDQIRVVVTTKTKLTSKLCNGTELSSLHRTGKKRLRVNEFEPPHAEISVEL